MNKLVENYRFIKFMGFINIYPMVTEFYRKTVNLSFLCVDISRDGQRVAVGSDEGKIYCWDGKGVGIKNILLSVLKISELGVISVSWHRYNLKNMFTLFLILYLSDPKG